jgi:hypothetical protein
MKPLFIAHAADDDHDVDMLATQLVIRGVPCAADHRGGFTFGDYVPTRAREVIGAECSGCIFYACDPDPPGTGVPPLFRSEFVRKLEVPAAVEARAADHGFVLAAVPRGMSYARLTELSVSAFGIDLSHHHTVSVSAHPDSLQHDMAAVARDVLGRVLARVPPGPLQLTFNTWRSEWPDDGDTLTIDWSHALGDRKSPTGDLCTELLAALHDIEAAASRRHRGRRIRVRGEWNLSAGLSFGHTFSRYPLDVEASGTTGYWPSDAPPAGGYPLKVAGSECSAHSSALYVGVSATDKNVEGAVRQLERSVGSLPFYRLFFQPSHGLSSVSVADSGVCRAMALQVRHEIARVVGRYSGAVDEIHLFISAPKQLAVILGHELSALPPIQLYEYDGHAYRPSFRLHSGTP